VTFALAAIAVAGGAVLLRRLGVTARRAPAAALPALGAVSAAATLVVWLSNPYLALVVVPAAHVWLLGTGQPSARRAVVVIAAGLLALVPLALALATIASDLDLGGAAPWTFTLMLADGQLGFVVAAAGCFVAGSLLGTASLALRNPDPAAPGN
jgi:hypothetical protein